MFGKSHSFLKEREGYETSFILEDHFCAAQK